FSTLRVVKSGDFYQYKITSIASLILAIVLLFLYLSQLEKHGMIKILIIFAGTKKESCVFEKIIIFV
ncbi:MAG: hypothetical protein EAZ44_11170, partial [Cytophagia bacterium]